ncbi:NAD(P)H-quinone oxidoreductase subunit I, chloroplastic [bioreactor metagenome]|uniref:NAD(P)H-quinone oxidoreductase subunit I, chloroplastic n=2 Tax=root TaxID=1 RepID=A0A644ZTP6_9ZZZZ
MSRVFFREERCKGCGHCIAVCPKKIISFSEKLNLKGYHPATVTEEKMSECIGCASCGKMCPDLVITVEKS